MTQPATTTRHHIRAATSADEAAVRDLLAQANLPLDGLGDFFADGYAVAEAAGAIVGAAGVEVYAGDGLLRSAVVAAPWRGRGVGDAMTRDRIRWARERGLRALYLLTTTATEYFPRFGFAHVAREAAPPGVRSSREFASACPDTAAFMRLPLTKEQ
jgi:amino-acid N-acetyltransferase